jgi:Tol biopolymer transport system component
MRPHRSTHFGHFMHARVRVQRLATFFATALLVVACGEGTTPPATRTIVAARASASVDAGSRLAFTSDRSGNYDVWSMNPDGTGLTNLTNNPAKDYAPAWSPDGAKLAFTSLRTGTLQIHVMNADGSAVSNISNSVGPDDQAAWSPDGTRIAFTSDRLDNGGSCPVFWDCTKVFVMNADGSAQSRLTNSYKDAGPAWSPNGAKIVYSSERTGNIGSGDRQIFVMNADGTGDTQLTTMGSNNSGPVWSPDGSRIAFQSVSGGKYGVYVMNADGTSPTRLTSGTTNDLWPAWSPDGARIAFGSDRDGNFEIYVMNADGSNQTRITNDPATDLEPKWTAVGAPGDVTPPVFASLSDLTTLATGPSGAIVSYTATATDNVGVTSIGCSPATGSIFPIGTTRVACTASDAAGNTAAASFLVSVKGASAQLADLELAIGDLVIHEGTATSLQAKLAAAARSFGEGNLTAACGQLSAMVGQIAAQSAKKVSASSAAALNDRVERVRAVVGCPQV